MMNDDGLKKVAELLEKFAGVTGQAVEKLWPLAVTAYRTDSYVSVAAGLFCLSVALAGFLALVKYIPARDKDELGFVFGTAGCVIAFVAGFFLVFCNLQGIVAPEGCLVLKLIAR